MEVKKKKKKKDRPATGKSTLFASSGCSKISFCRALAMANNKEMTI
jgi:hypothetical protein